MKRCWAHWAFLSCGFVVLAAGLAAAGPEVDAFLNDFRISGDYLLSIGGKRVADAELYYSERSRAYLVLARELPTAILVSPAAQDVQGVDRQKLLKRPDGALDVAADAELRSVGSFRLDGEAIQFLADQRSCRLEPRPWLLGPQTGAGMQEANPEYARRAREYRPDPRQLERLREYRGEPVRVLTFFGSWCPFCKKHVPFLMRLEKELAGAPLRFEYYGLPEAFSQEPEARRYGVRGVPTAVVFQGSRELGRIAPAQWQQPEAALAELLSSRKD